jgi:hypothetical protein
MTPCSVWPPYYKFSSTSGQTEQVLPSDWRHLPLFSSQLLVPFQWSSHCFFMSAFNHKVLNGWSHSTVCCDSFPSFADFSRMRYHRTHRILITMFGFSTNPVDFLSSKLSAHSRNLCPYLCKICFSQPSYNIHLS